MQPKHPSIDKQLEDLIMYHGEDDFFRHLQEIFESLNEEIKDLKQTVIDQQLKIDKLDLNKQDRPWIK